MRIKPLLKYYFIVNRFAITVFFICFMAGTLIGSVANSLSQGGVVVLGAGGDVLEDGTTTSWSVSIFGFAIFMLITNLITSQMGTRFLITRSATRKEIFVSNALFMLPLAAAMALLQVLSICIDGGVRALLTGNGFRGLKLDLQVFQAPDMTNFLVFFLVSCAVLFLFGSLGYLLGTLLARFKIQTLAVLVIGGIAFVACLILPGFITKVVDALKFMFTDDNHGLIISVKQLVLGVLLLAAAFPVSRRITAVKQSQ